MNELYNDVLERELTSQLMTNADTQGFLVAAAMLREDAFHDPKAAALWAILAELTKNGRVINVSNVYAEAVKTMPQAKAIELATMDEGDCMLDVQTHAETIAALAGKRAFVDAMREAVAKMREPDTTLEECTEIIRKAVNDTTAQISGMKDITSVFRELMKDIEDQIAGREAPMVETGFGYIDRRGGLKAGNLDIIAGRTSNGKTSLALAIAVNAAIKGAPVAVYSLEMTVKELGKRIASMLSGVGDWKQMDIDKAQAIMDGMDKAWGVPIHFDGTRTSDIDNITWSIRNLVRDKGIKVAVIDYLQLLTSKRAADTRTMLAEACVRLKNLAVELDITIIALSQLARCKADAASHEPKMEQLKESGEIENSADNVYMVYRAELYDEPYTGDFKEYSTEGTAMVINSKSRSGAVGSFLCGFNPECTLYYDNPTLKKAGTETKKNNETDNYWYD